MVILIHALSVTLSKSVKNDMDYITFVGVYVISRPAVNIFILISAYFSYDKVDFEYKKLFRKITIPIIHYIPIIFIYSIILEQSQLGMVKSVIFNIYNMFSLGGLFFHLWYMVCYAILFLLVLYIGVIIK